MGATNTTTYYNLSQFVGTDKPAWLQDYNGDMLKIDTAINAAKVAADAAALDASAAQLDATTALGDITNTITPAITSLQTTVGNQGGAINTINSLIGNGTPTTTDQTIIGAINEINANVGQISTNLDGVKVKKLTNVSISIVNSYGQSNDIDTGISGTILGAVANCTTNVNYITVNELANDPGKLSARLIGGDGNPIAQGTSRTLNIVVFYV